MPGKNSRPWIIGAAGFLAGASIGFVYRPPAFLLGQLPLDIVITRGSRLKGLDQVYIPVAERSFNYILVGGIVGAALGFLIGWMLLRRRAA